MHKERTDLFRKTCLLQKNDQYEAVERFSVQQQENLAKVFQAVIPRVPTHFRKPFSILFQYLFNTELKDFNTVIWLHFRNFYSWTTVQKHLQNCHQW